jgi:hypothetical protein
MRISELEENSEDRGNIGSEHAEWLQANPGIDSKVADAVKSQALLFFNKSKTITASMAHGQAQMKVGRASDAAQDRRWDRRQNNKDKFVGIPRRQRGGQIGNQNAVKPGGQVRTGADGRQLRHDRWHGSGDPMGRWGKPGGKNAIQQMKDKWKEFQKADGTFGKDVAKGSLLARGAEKAGKGIVAMGDRARAAAKSRFN